MGNMRKAAKPVLCLCLFLAIIADRSMWASVSQWREDQATNLWLGYTQDPTHSPVGLISSARIPNPNGMVLLGSLLSRLPNLWVISAFLGCLQAATILGICWRSFPRSSGVFFLTSAPLLGSMVLRGSSVEFWNQWLLTTVNILFFLWAVLYMRRPTLYKIPAVVALAVFSPAIYLGGLVNAVVMTGIGAALIVLMPPQEWRRYWWRAAVFSLAIVALSVWLVWYPYFQCVSLRDILTATSHASLLTRVSQACESLALSPIWSTLLPSDRESFAILQRSPSILSPSASKFVDITLAIQLAQVVLAAVALLIALRRYAVNPVNTPSPLPDVTRNARRLVLLSAAFLLASYALSPLLGGGMWATGERRDQVVQFFPFFALTWFLTPLSFRLSEVARKMLIIGTTLVALVYLAASIVGGVLVVHSHLSYRGSFLSEADVPLVYKMQAVDFIAHDWQSISSSKVIPVDYRLGGKWEWVPEFGEALTVWYKAPFTTGRSFDFDLLRRYGLRNAQEGVQRRTFGTARYLVTYAFEPAPNPDGSPVRHYIFGRLRVTVDGTP
jgi:hypothetical protein